MSEYIAQQASSSSAFTSSSAASSQRRWQIEGDDGRGDETLLYNGDDKSGGSEWRQRSNRGFSSASSSHCSSRVSLQQNIQPDYQGQVTTMTSEATMAYEATEK